MWQLHLFPTVNSSLSLSRAISTAQSWLRLSACQMHSFGLSAIPLVERGLSNAEVRSFTDFILEDYVEEKRPVYMQELNLTDTQKKQIADALMENYRPENCEYLYNFVEDNCSTRPFRLLKEVLGDSLKSTYKGHEGESFRKFIRRYTGEYTVIDAL